MAYFLPKSERLIYNFKIRTKRALLEHKGSSKTILLKGRTLIILLRECFSFPPFLCDQGMPVLNGSPSWPGAAAVALGGHPGLESSPEAPQTRREVLREQLQP